MAVEEKFLSEEQKREELQKDLEKQARTAMRVIDFIMEDDETFFHEITEGLTDEEMEEYLKECPEDRKYWEKDHKR